MPTLRQICSDIQSDLRANNKDDRSSYRQLVSKIKDKARNFIKQDADNRRLFKSPDLWQSFPIVDLTEVPYINYDVDIPDVRTVMKSTKKIAKTISSNYGNLLRIFTISGDTEYKLIPKIQYKDILNAEYRDKSLKYAWIEDGFLEIPDSGVEKVKLVGFPENPEETDCDVCAKPLDYELSLPGYLIDIIKKDILNEMLEIKKFPKDENPNSNVNEK